MCTDIQPLTRSDAGLATVLGHEVAHATAEHVAERLEHQAVALWKRVARASKGKEPPEFASDHPSHQHRI